MRIHPGRYIRCILEDFDRKVEILGRYLIYRCRYVGVFVLLYTDLSISPTPFYSLLYVCTHTYLPYYIYSTS